MTIREGVNDTLEFCEGLRVGSGHPASTSFWVLGASAASPTDIADRVESMASLPAYTNYASNAGGGAAPDPDNPLFHYPAAVHNPPVCRHYLSNGISRLQAGSVGAIQYGGDRLTCPLPSSAVPAGGFLHTLPLTKQEIVATVNAYPSFPATLRYRESDGRFVFRLRSRPSEKMRIDWPAGCDRHCLEALGFRRGQSFDGSSLECAASRAPQYHFRAQIPAGHWASQGAANYRVALLHELNKGSLLASNTDQATTGEMVQANAVLTNTQVDQQKQGALVVLYSDGHVRPLWVSVALPQANGWRCTGGGGSRSRRCCTRCWAH